jgi:hypothetical protein
MTTNGERVLSGRLLRYAAAVALFEGERTMTLAELVAAIQAQGIVVLGDPRKSVSDSLRWEMHKRRAMRVSRGRYRSLGLARSTHRWMREQVR